MKNRLFDLLTSPTSGDRRQSTESAIDTERLRITAEEWISKNPAAALGAALAVGVLLGWLIKRK
jgi:ElaB/YqjD/DUF883 family membrane-anchored ribosome-binding protein